MTLSFLLLSRFTGKSHNYLIRADQMHFFLVFLCTMWNLPFLILGLPFTSLYHILIPWSLLLRVFGISFSSDKLLNADISEFYVFAYFFFYTELSCVPDPYVWLLTTQWTTSWHLNSICLMVQPASKMVLTIHASLCSYPFAVLSHTKLCWPK